MNDPYEILGVSKKATDEEIKTAYRNLAKKYHPDNYNDNPLSDLAEEKMEEINAAYDKIMSERKRKAHNKGTDYSANSNFPKIRSLINQNMLDAAQSELDSIPVEQRNAEWYFLNGSVLYKRGWYDNAYTCFSTAVRMDPQNMEYREAFNRINNKRSGFNNAGNPYRSSSNMGGCSGCDVCQGLICADCCCECMGGDLIRCC